MSKDKSRFSNDIQIKNRKASYEYEFVEKAEAGIMLKGTEIKSLREGKASIQEAYCFFRKDELFVKGMNISPYSQASFESHDMTRDRKLLLKKRELEKFKSKMDEKGLTIVPIRIYINKRGLAKLEIALAKGKKIYDKRDSIKKKDQKRELDRMKI
ncbi:SsrA-binding protein SmpB [Ekhidna sp. To15]|uniref:SsrA-binding protein SmpB n=1 Tax=Ekhidna sp. To15 TaxID=3395267 RepID=UPI003F51C905